MYNDFLFKAERLDTLGFFKEADIVTSKIAQNTQSPDQFGRTLNNYNYLFRFFNQSVPAMNNFFTKLQVLTRCIRYNVPLPASMTQDVGFWQAFKGVFSDPNITQDIGQYLQYFPQLKQDLSVVRLDFLKQLPSQIAKGGISNLYKSWQESKVLLRNDVAGGVSGIQDTLQQGSAAAAAGRLNNKLNAVGMDVSDTIVKLSNFHNENLVAGIKNIGELKANLILTKKHPQLQNPKAQQYIDNILAKIVDLPDSVPISNGMIDVEAAMSELKTVAAGLGDVTKATANGTAAASKLAKFIPALGKLSGALGIICSFPAMQKWTPKIISGDVFNEDPENNLNFWVDLGNIFSSAAMFIPGGAGVPVAAIVGAFVIALQTGDWAINKFVTPNAQDQLINANSPEERQKILDKMSTEDKYDIQHQDWWVDELLSEVEPGGDFSDYMNSKYPNKAIKTSEHYAGGLSGFIEDSIPRTTFSSVKTAQAMNYFTQAGFSPESYTGNAEQNERLRAAIDHDLGVQSPNFSSAFVKKFGKWIVNPSERVQKLLGSQPSAIDPVTEKPSEFYDPKSLKMLDIINGLTSWIQSLPPNRQKNYSWFINPTDQNKQMKEQFLQKLNQWHTGLKAQKPATTSFNLRKYQLTKIGRQY